MASNHIMLPKTTLKQFSVSGKITYLDLSDNTIHSSTAKSFNTKENYYPEETEQFLSGRIETAIGRLRLELDKFSGDGHETFTITPQFENEAFECFIIQLMRRPSFAKVVRDKSIFGNVFNVPDEFFSGLHRGKEYIDIAFKSAEKLLTDYTANICTIDKGDGFSFILPSAHCFSAGSYIFFVLSPYRAIVLMPKEDLIKYADANEEKCFFYKFDDYKVLEGVYKKAIQAEMKDGVGKIVGLKQQLELIQKIL